MVLHHGRGTMSATCSGSRTCSTPSAAAMSPARGLRWRSPARRATTGTSCRGSATPTRRPSRRRSKPWQSTHDRLWEELGVEPARTVLGGFSMGSVMSYATALSAGRPPVAGILAFSGFVPAVEGWDPSFEDRQDTAAFVAHGRADPVIGVDFGRRARDLLEGAGLPLEYHESDVGHQIDPGTLSEAAGWLDRTLG